MIKKAKGKVAFTRMFDHQPFHSASISGQKGCPMNRRGRQKICLPRENSASLTRGKNSPRGMCEGVRKRMGLLPIGTNQKVWVKRKWNSREGKRELRDCKKGNGGREEFGSGGGWRRRIDRTKSYKMKPGRRLREERKIKRSGKTTHILKRRQSVRKEEARLKHFGRKCRKSEAGGLSWEEIGRGAQNQKRIIT